MAAMHKMFFLRRHQCRNTFRILVDAFEAELKSFPAGKHDATVDAATLFGRMLDRIMAGKPVEGPDGTGDTLEDTWVHHD